MRNVICAILITLISFYNQCISQIKDLDDINKTMVIFEKSFKVNKTISDNDESVQLFTNDYSCLLSIMSDSFIGTDKFKELCSTTINNYVNLGYTQEICNKKFLVYNKSKLKGALWVKFIRDDYFNDEKWHIYDTYVTKQDTVIKFNKRGLNPGAIDFNFSDFTSLIRRNALDSYSGLAPFGQLPKSFLTDNRIDRTLDTILFVKNIFICDTIGKPVDLAYLKIEYFNSVQSNKKGWLVTDYGKMLDYYKKYGKKDLLGIDEIFIDYLDNSLDKYDMNRDSKYFWMNIGQRFLPVINSNESN